MKDHSFLNPETSIYSNAELLPIYHAASSHTPKNFLFPLLKGAYLSLKLNNYELQNAELVCWTSPLLSSSLQHLNAPISDKCDSE